MRRTLAREHDVTPVTSGKDALALLAKGERYHLILCDLLMPEMTGMELFDEATRLEPGLEKRFVFMTGGAFTSGAQAFFERVSNARLNKPFDSKALRAVVREHAVL